MQIQAQSVAETYCRSLLMHRIIHYLLLIAKFPGGGVQSSNYLPLIGYLLHPLIGTLAVKHE
jgi:hypothetical protein